jgi:aspartate racemase
MADYQAALREDAAQRRSRGLTVKDQDQRDEVFCLLPARPEGRPLVIIGGMGPLAGAIAFGRACARFEDSRAVVLYQACTVPDRSTVILEEGRPDTPACRHVAARLASAVRRAVGLVPAGLQPARCVIACNSAHYFWPLVLDELRRPAALPCRVEMISLVQSSAEALRRLACRSVLILATEGARIGQVFSAPLHAAGIPFDEPSPSLGKLLMRTVFEGVKALDGRRAVAHGNELFEAVARSGRDHDSILAGCTELPLAIALLRRHGRPAVRAFLSRVSVIDPLEEALGHA